MEDELFAEALDEIVKEIMADEELWDDLEDEDDLDEETMDAYLHALEKDD